MLSTEARYFRIIKSIGAKHLTTIELEAIMKEQSAQCPDDLARTLNIMRRKGLIKGAVSTERGGWVWWVEEPEK